MIAGRRTRNGERTEGRGRSAEKPTQYRRMATLAGVRDGGAVLAAVVGDVPANRKRGVMGIIQDVNPRVWVEWRKESVVIGEQDGTCEIGYEDLQALIAALASSTQKDSRFIKWEIARGKR